MPLLLQPDTIVWIIFAGVCAASFYAFFQKKVAGSIIRAIIDKESFDEQNAKTLGQLGYTGKIKEKCARFLLKDGSTLRKYIKECVKEDNSKAYFIPEDKKISAECRYDSDGMSVKTLMLSILGLFIAAIVAIRFLPEISKLLSGIFKQ